MQGMKAFLCGFASALDIDGRFTFGHMMSKRMAESDVDALEDALRAVLKDGGIAWSTATEQRASSAKAA